MLCSICGFENVEGIKFCGECASPLNNRCPKCGFENTPGYKFCGECATSLTSAPPVTDDLICPQCNKSNASNAAFCNSCGHSLSPPTVAEPAAPQVEEQPTSFANGRYTVSKFLGEGGKKKVYLAQDTLLDRDVAFALIKTEGLDDVARTRISREAQSMGRLGSHPHIVTVFDLGDHEGQPFMVTELMSGGDVEAIIEDAPEHKLPLEQAIRIAMETCRGLEFAHSRGIVHRDLKPGNIWLTGDETAKIGDFGLAVATDRSRLTQEGMMVGTVSYMPPEQAMGGEVTAQSDLYSLGAMLYEMVAGRPPFLGDDSVAIIGQHINTPPVSPTWHRNDCPKPLESLIMRLLAKNPTERPESATDVITALEAVDLSIAATSEEESPDEAHVLDSLAGGIFVGRQREMGDMKAALEDSLSGRGRMITLVGEPGIGKTRTAQELVTYAGLRGVQVLWGRCYEEQGVPPYWPWVQAIRSYVRDIEPERLRSEMRAGAADIAEIVSDVKDVLPDLQPPPQLDSPEQARFRLFDSITAFLRSASQRQPIMLVLDDLHWADTPSLLLLQFVARELTGSRLLLVGTYRDVELNRQHPLAETLGELTRERLFERVVLRGLTHNDVSRFIEITSGITPPRTLSQAVHSQTEGNPLFVTEVVRLLVQEGELTAENVRERDSWEIRVPEGVREVIGRRLNRLSQRCNETLTIASVIGREFTLEQLDRLIDDLNQEMLLDVLEEGLAAKVIDELPTSVGLYQFTHALIQETLIDELSLTRRVRLHAQIAETLEELFGDAAESHAAELANHFAQAEAVLGDEKLLHYSLLAGEKALANYAYEQAINFFKRGLEPRKAESLDGITADMTFGLGRAQMGTAERHRMIEAVGIIRQAFDYYEMVGDVSKAIDVANTPIVPLVGQPTGAQDILQRALSLAPENSLQAGHLWCNLGRRLGAESGNYKEAQIAFNNALNIAGNFEDDVLKAGANSDAAMIDLMNGEWVSFSAHCAAGIESAVKAGDKLQESNGRFYLSTGEIWQGHPQEAREQILMGLPLAEELRTNYILDSYMFTLQLISQLQGNWSSAKEYNERGLESSPNSPHLLGGRAILELQTGNYESAEGYIERLIGAMKQSPKGPTQEYAYTSSVIPIWSRVTGEKKWLNEAEFAITTVVSSSNVLPHLERVARIGKSVISVINQDEPSARDQYEHLSAVPKGLYGFYYLDSVLGLLAQTMGNLDDAQTHFEDALAFCRKAGYRPELAWSLCDYADMLLERNEDTDRQKAMQLLDESLSISTDLGMRPLMERVLSRREILKA